MLHGVQGRRELMDGGPRQNVDLWQQVLSRRSVSHYCDHAPVIIKFVPAVALFHGAISCHFIASPVTHRVI
jgi:hypothetical protein